MSLAKIEDVDGRTERRPRRGTWAVVAAVLLTVILVGHRLIPNVHGLGSLVDTVAPFFGLGVPVLAVAALLHRSRRALVAVLAPALVWAALFGTAWWPDGGGPVRLRVASQNLRAGNPDPGATVAALAATGADVIGLQEVSDGAQAPVARVLHGDYRYHAVSSTVELWSRFPIRTYTAVDIGLAWTRGLRAVVAAPQHDMVVYVVHLGSARAGQTSLRDHTVQVLAAELRRDPAARLLVLGDLNTAATDRVITPLTDLLRDAQADAGSGPGFTWPAALPLTRPDHILYRGMTASAAGVVRTPESDHRAVTAGFRG